MENRRSLALLRPPRLARRKRRTAATQLLQVLMEAARSQPSALKGDLQFPPPSVPSSLRVPLPEYGGYSDRMTATEYLEALHRYFRGAVSCGIQSSGYRIREALPRYEARLQRLGWQTLQQRRTVARIGFLCRCLDGSLDDSYISSVVRYSKRTGQPEPMYARTVRHQNSLIPATVRDFLSAPRHVRTPLPSDRASSRELCRTVARSLRNRA
ncbi:hypothetical protein HPB49_004692 [Dermacentor silvarum]|uniref:Uncharacterized protein n=1 Tax=Dermacentor silvarum TaxID=543639 RepID=A0ACB8DV20_DERSI|nr:hypothetical protein HPB49_004692 [Dermacentor silvarum]